MEMPGQHQRDLAVRLAGRVRVVGDRHVHRRARRLLVPERGRQPGTGQLLRPGAPGLRRAVGGELWVSHAREAQFGHRDRPALVQDVHVLRALQIALGDHRVMVAAYPHVGRLRSSSAPSGETLIFVPPASEGRRVIVVFMGPTGTRTFPTISRPSQAPSSTTATRPRARDQGWGWWTSSTVGYDRRARY